MTATASSRAPTFLRAGLAFVLASWGPAAGLAGQAVRPGRCAGSGAAALAGTLSLGSLGDPQSRLGAAQLSDPGGAIAGGLEFVASRKGQALSGPVASSLPRLGPALFQAEVQAPSVQPAVALLEHLSEELRAEARGSGESLGQTASGLGWAFDGLARRARKALSRAAAAVALPFAVGCVSSAGHGLPGKTASAVAPGTPSGGLSRPPPGALPDSPRQEVPPPIRLEWGRSPRYLSDGRLFESGAHLLGWGGDRLLVDRVPGGEGGRIAARMAKGIVLEIPFAAFGMAYHHEWGHFKAAWDAGVTDISFVNDSRAFVGATPTIGALDAEKMSESESLEYHSGGIFATQSSMDDARRRMLEQDFIHASALPLWFAEKADASIYSFFLFPRVGREKAEEESGDLLQWNRRFSDNTGRSYAAVRQAVLKGAIWNALDPMALWAAYAYFYRYWGLGEERLRSPMLRLGGYDFMAGTGFWLSRVGPQYRLALFVRHAESGSLFALAPTLGERGQWAVEAELRNIPIGSRTRGRLFGALWRQRDDVVPGPKELGGAAGAGLELRLRDWLGVALNGGYKAEGALLGRSFKEGVFLEGGLVLFPERTPAR